MKLTTRWPLEWSREFFFLTSLCYLLWKNKSPLQNIFAQFLDCWACVIFSYFPLCSAPKLIPSCRGLPSNLDSLPSLSYVLDAWFSQPSRAALWTSMYLSAAQQHLWWFWPPSHGWPSAGMWVWFCAAGHKAPRSLILFRCQQSPRLSKGLNAVRRHLNLNSRQGGRTEETKGRTEQEREKESSPFHFIFFKSIFFFSAKTQQ